MKTLRSTVTKKVIVCFNNFGDENFKVAAFVIFPTSIKVGSHLEIRRDKER